MMGHQGMRYSLVSREVIADCIEVVAGGMNHDGVLAIGGCDKNMPGCLMGMARLNVPSIFVYGGSILPGTGVEGNDIDIVSIFEAVGQFQAGKLDEAGVHQVECEACPGAGSCGGMYTANTMSSRHRGHGHVAALRRQQSRGVGRQGTRNLSRRQDAGAPDRARTSSRATSSRANRWRTPTRSCWRWAARPTPSCI